MGTGNSAAKAAQQANADNQAAIDASVQQIQNAYSSPSRQQQYQQYGQQLQDFYTNNVNNQEQVNARNLKFALARSGLTGGSAAVDSNTQLQKDYTNGLVQASQQAQAGQAALQQADVNSKNQLVSLAEQGGNIGSIPTQVAQAQSTNLGTAQAYGNTNALNNLFTGTAGIYQGEQVAAANRQAQANPIGSFYGPSAFTQPPGGGAYGTSGAWGTG
jgi:hypothetical protein